MEQQIQFNLSYRVTFSFSLLPLTGTTSILSSIIGGVFKLPTAKFINIIGRAEGFVIMTLFATLGELNSSEFWAGLMRLRAHHDGCLSKRGDLCCCTGKSLLLTH